MINTPEELLKYMEDFKYEWMDKKGNFHDEITPNMYEDYSFMKPSEVLEHKKGICVDQAEFERDWFEKHGFEHKVMVIQLKRADEWPGHAFLIYKSKNKYCWFENAWLSQKGIHKYNSYDELIQDVKQKFIIQNDITNDEVEKIEIFEQIQYPYHLSYKEMDEYEPMKSDIMSGINKDIESEVKRIGKK